MTGGRPSHLVIVTIIAVLVILPVAALSSLFRNAEATTTVISSNTTFPATTINAGDTLIINPGVFVTMSGTLTNRGNIVNSGTINMNLNVLNNYGIIIDAAGGGIKTGTVNNYESGIIKEDSGSTHNYADTFFSNYGKHISYGDVQVSYQNATSGSEDKAYKNFATGVFESHSAARFFGFYNYGGQVTFHQGASLQHSFGGGGLFTNGTIDNYGLLSVQGNYPGAIEIGLDGILNNHVGGTILNSIRPGYEGATTIYGTLNNDGRFANVGHMRNIGSFNNNGILENNVGGGGNVLGIVDNSGIFNNDGSISNKGVVNNLQRGNFDNDGSFVNECGGTFNNQGTFTGNPVVNNCASFPITHMSDTTASSGYGVFSSKPSRAELVTPSSQLIGDKIDSITLRLKRVGTITGTAEIGVFNNDLSVKKLFGTLNVATLTTSYAEYEFHLTGGELYTIQSGDRIGIKYTGGSSITWVSVMLDLDAADPFDGTNSYAQYYQGSWLSNTDRDMYMILKQTHG